MNKNIKRKTNLKLNISGISKKNFKHHLRGLGRNKFGYYYGLKKCLNHCNHNNELDINPNATKILHPRILDRDEPYNFNANHNHQVSSKINEKNSSKSEDNYYFGDADSVDDDDYEDEDN